MRALFRPSRASGIIRRVNDDLSLASFELTLNIIPQRAVFGFSVFRQ